jgi:hypothetical protein
MISDCSDFFFTTTVVLDFDNFMKYQEKLTSFHLNGFSRKFRELSKKHPDSNKIKHIV